jgi:DNA polymerase III subunit epsilon
MSLLTRARPASEAAAAYARASLPGGGTPWREADWCAVDLELSGLDAERHEIISLAAVPVCDGRVRLAEAVSGLARPLGVVPGESVRVHGLRTLDLTDAPELDEAIDALLGAMAGRVLVAHAAGVERAFLRPALRRRGIRLRGPIVDTSVIGKLWLHERDGRMPARLPLGVLAESLGLPAHSPHTALGDALTTAQAFIALATHLDRLRRETVRSLARAGDRVEAAMVYSARRLP